MLGGNAALDIRNAGFQFGTDKVTDGSGHAYALHNVATKSGGFRRETSAASAGLVVGIASLHVPIVVVTHSGSTPKPASHHSGKLIPMPKSMLAKYAKDYQDFCTAAKATACVYLPSAEWWETVNMGTGEISTTPFDVTVVDPMITNSKICRSEGGTIGSEGCNYKYPFEQLVDFTPAATNPYVLQCPDGQGGTPVEFDFTLDPHGAVEILTISSAWGKNHQNLIHCVVQVYT